MAKSDRFRKVKVTQNLRISGLFGGGWRGPEGQHHQIESQEESYHPEKQRYQPGATKRWQRGPHHFKRPFSYPK